jgi:hypothetical protein
MRLNDKVYVAARSHGRPVLIHKVKHTDVGSTLCGLDLTGWSREYLYSPLDVLYCLRCKKFEAAGSAGQTRKVVSITSRRGRTA